MAENDNNAYLPPQEQMIIAAKVNRLCETEKANFEISQIDDAAEIIKAPAPRTKIRGSVSATFSYTSRGKSDVKMGATNAGNVNASFDETKVYKKEFGVEEYRIGNYVATRFRGKKDESLTFEFWRDRGEINTVFNKYPDRTSISFDPKTYNISEISKLIHTGNRNIFCLRIVNFGTDTIWKKD